MKGNGRSRLRTWNTAVDEINIHSRIEALGLTHRQQMVVELVLQGLSNRQIAGQLSIEELTVKVHLRDIFHKLKLHSRTALIAKALQINKHLPGIG